MRTTAPKLLIIQPSYYRSKLDRAVFQCRRRNVVSLTLPYLAALTPPDWEVRLLDEQLEPVDFGYPADVVALTTWTLHSTRAYHIADAFRHRGIPVIMGGPHTTFHNEEAIQHCDALGIGEGEPLWPKMLEDALARRSQPIYRAEPLSSLAGLPMPRYDLLDLRRYGPFRTFTVVSSRGCPFRCDFCAERYLLGDQHRCRPVPEVAEEIKRCGSRRIFFGDSNFGGKRTHAMQLMETIVPLRLRWSALWPSYLCRDAEFLDLAQRSGLLHVNVGIESIESETLEAMHKRFNKVQWFSEMLTDLRRRGISYSLNFIFGWDGESGDVFRSTLGFLMEHKVPAAYFNILTPEKGTPLYDRLRSEGRLMAANEIGRWPGEICHIKPQRGTPEALEGNIQKLYRDFYSLSSICSRLSFPLTASDLASWVINLSQRRMARQKLRGTNFDRY